MNLKTYMLLDCDDSNSKLILTVKLVKGFTAKDITEQFNIQESWTPREDGSDNIFFFSGCSVPRFKVRKKWSTTIKPSKATVLFIDPLNVTGSESTFKIYSGVGSVPMTSLISFLLVLNDDRVKALINSLKPLAHSILLTSRLWDTYGNRTCFTIDNTSLYDHKIRYWQIKNGGEGSSMTDLYGFSPDSDLLKVDFEKVTVCNANAILPFLNENKMIIDENKYKELCSLGNSSQAEDIVVMMELMANSDYDKSIPYLLSLFYNFGREISDQPEVNHVNFKSLMNYCGLKNSQLSYNLNLQLFVNILKSKKLFTKDNALILLSILNGVDKFDN